MRVKKLEAAPLSGEFDEVVFEFESPWRGSGWNYAIFYTSDHEEWVGMFRVHDLANFKIAELDNGIVCVVSGGHGYIVDIDKRIKLKDLETDQIIEIRSDNQTSSFYIATWFQILRVGQDLKEVEIDLPIQADTIWFKEDIDRKLNLSIQEIGADGEISNEFYIDLDSLTVKKHMP